ncbi:GntR family transcriptional regulator [bacterium]|nr:GntR family transcriptional regulator [bacterium]
MNNTTEQVIENKQTTSEYAYIRLRNMIESGELKPGMRLIHRELAKRLDTSNIPIILAISRLEHDGLVVSVPNHGAQVVDWTYEEMECAILIRSHLEQMAAKCCAERASEEQRTKIKDLASKYKDYSIANNVAGCLETDDALHTLVVKCSGIDLLIRMLNNSRVITNTIRNICWLSTDVSRSDIHDGLVEAIVTGDQELAKAKAKEHIDDLLAKFVSRCKR